MEEKKKCPGLLSERRSGEMMEPLEELLLRKR